MRLREIYILALVANIIVGMAPGSDVPTLDKLIDKVQTEARTTDGSNNEVDPNKRNSGFKIDSSAFASVNFLFQANMAAPPVLPVNFTATTNWPQCKDTFERIVDQGNCGSCWAVSAANVLSDRYCVKNLQIKFFSYQDVLECCSFCGIGCGGGSTLNAFQYFNQTGIVTGGLYQDNKSCKPYFFPPCNDPNFRNTIPCRAVLKLPACTYSCQDSFNQNSCRSSSPNPDSYKTCINNPFQIYFGDKSKSMIYYRISKNESEIMLEIFQNGPITAGFLIYTDFFSYKSGVYKYTSGFFQGAHAIKIIGWGEEKGVKYWLCVNSWGPLWGENGNFKIIRGINHLYIEQFLVTAQF